MTAYEELQKILSEKTADCAGLPLTATVAKVRVVAVREIERFLKVKGRWNTAKRIPPTELFSVTNEGTVIKIHLDERLKQLLA